MNLRTSIRSVVALIMFLLLAFVLLLPAAGTVAGHQGTDCGCSTTETSETYSTSTAETTDSTTSTETTATTTTETTTTGSTTTVTKHITPPPTSADAGTTTQGQSGGALVIIAVLGMLGLIVFLLYNPQRPQRPEPTTGEGPVQPEGVMTSIGTYAILPNAPDSHGEGL